MQRGVQDGFDMTDEIIIELDDSAKGDSPEDVEKSDFVNRLSSFISSSKPVGSDNAPEVIKNLPFFEEAYNLSLAREFTSTDDFWKSLAVLPDTGHDKPFLETHRRDPGEKIIALGDNKQSIFWLLEGELEIFEEVKAKIRKVNSLKEKGQCFGVLTTLLGIPRTAEVIVSKSGGAVILEADWAITTIPSLPEISNFFHILIAKTVAHHLNASYHRTISIAKKAARYVVEAKEESAKLREDSIKLNSLMDKMGISDEDLAKINFDRPLENAVDNLRDLLDELRKQQ